MMYYFSNAETKREACRAFTLLWANCLFWPFAAPVGTAVLCGIVVGLFGIDPVDYGLDYLVKALLGVAGAAAGFWTLCFLLTALFFGISPNLLGLLHHRSLNGAAILRFVNAIVLWAPRLNGAATISESSIRRQPCLVRSNRLALSTSSDLAGAAPLLQ